MASYDQTASRLKLHQAPALGDRRSPRTEADAEHVKVKTEMLQMRLMEQQRKLVRREDVNELLDEDVRRRADASVGHGGALLA